MTKTEFRIDELKFGNGEKEYFIFYKTFSVFGFPKWRLYKPAHYAFTSMKQTEEWLSDHLKEKELSKIEPYVSDRKFITI